MWEFVAGPFLAAAGLLVVAGLPKLADPLPLVPALRSAGMPGNRLLVRGFAAAEVAIGVWAVLAPGRLVAGLVAAAYVVFTAFIARVLTRGGVLGSCGCFGKPDTPATRTHLVLTAAAALVAGAVAVDPPAEAWSAVDGATLVTAGLAAVIGFLAWQVMAVLPTVSPAAIRSATRSATRSSASGPHRTTVKG
jgi:hypothetical protein